MLFVKNKDYDKNLKRFNFYVSELINKANAMYPTPDCYPYIKPDLERTIEKSKSQIENWNESTDVCTLAHKALYNIAFDVISSGELHIYRGELNPLKPSNKLLFIIDECINYFVKNGFISSEDAEGQRQLLQENIAKVG